MPYVYLSERVDLGAWMSELAALGYEAWPDADYPGEYMIRWYGTTVWIADNTKEMRDYSAGFSAAKATIGKPAMCLTIDGFGRNEREALDALLAQIIILASQKAERASIDWMESTHYLLRPTWTVQQFWDAHTYESQAQPGQKLDRGWFGQYLGGIRERVQRPLD